MWNAETFDVGAIIKRNGKKIEELPLQYSGGKSQFSVTYTPPGPGVYTVTVYGYDSSNGNTGLDNVSFIVKKPKK